ncbi:MAG: hypothetical protein JO329_20870, partial [Planctomycetaceae bacterium]|nr:hypothetical protein [Planctomycetaceae bacterium]
DSERRWALALAGLEPHRWHEDAAVRRLVTLDLATQVDGGMPEETRRFVVARLKLDEAAMNVTPYEFEVRVEALLASLPEPAAARAELLAWARAWIVELEAHLDEVEESARRDRELAVEEALFDSGPSGAARLRAELAQDRVLRTSLQEVRRLQRERAEADEAEDSGATDVAAGSRDASAPTEPNFEAKVLSMTAEATAPTEPKRRTVCMTKTQERQCLENRCWLFGVNSWRRSAGAIPTPHPNLPPQGGREPEDRPPPCWGGLGWGGSGMR